MEDSRRSNTANDGLLLPLHNAPGQQTPLTHDGATDNHPVSPTSPTPFPQNSGQSSQDPFDQRRSSPKRRAESDLEEGRTSPAGTSDRPLIPPKSPAQRPRSGELSADYVASPTSDRRSRRVVSADVQHEKDIADAHRQLNEKYDRFPLSRRHTTGEAKAASVEEEAQAVDWIVPVQNGLPPIKDRTVGERLKNTLDVAKEEQAKYQKQARNAGLAINAAMFIQIMTNAIITGLSASTSNRHAQIGVSAMGAINTIISSFLVRARGTREPERSITHSQNLEKYIRELEAFILDEGLSRDRKWDSEVKRFREQFDKLQTAVHQSENGQPMSDSPSTTTTIGAPIAAPTK